MKIKFILFVFIFLIACGDIKEKEECLISDKNDPELFKNLINYYFQHKIGSEGKSQEFTSYLLKSYNKYNKHIKECFFLDPEDLEEMKPIIQLTSLDSAEYIMSLQGQETMVKFIKGLKFLTNHTTEEFCNKEMLTATNSTLLNMIVSVSCTFRKYFHEDWKKREDFQKITQNPEKLKELIKNNDKRIYVPSRSPLYKDISLFEDKYDEYKKADELYENKIHDIPHPNARKYKKMFGFVDDIKENYYKLKAVHVLLPALKFMLFDSKGHEILSHHFNKNIKSKHKSIKHSFYSMMHSLHELSKISWKKGTYSKFISEWKYQYKSGDIGNRFRYLSTVNEKRKQKRNQVYYSDYYKSQEYLSGLKIKDDIQNATDSYFQTDKTPEFQQNDNFMVHPISSTYNLFHTAWTIDKFPFSYINMSHYNIFGGSSEDEDDEATTPCFTGLGPTDSNILCLGKLSNYPTLIKFFIDWFFCIGGEDEANCKYCAPYLWASENNCKWFEICTIGTTVTVNVTGCEDFSSVPSWSLGFWYWSTNDYICDLISSYPTYENFLKNFLYENGNQSLPTNIGWCLLFKSVEIIKIGVALGLIALTIGLLLCLIRESKIDNCLEYCKDQIKQIKENDINTKASLEDSIDELDIKYEKMMNEITNKTTKRLEKIENALIEIGGTLKRKKILDEICFS